jgi:hypothetical protein
MGTSKPDDLPAALKEALSQILEALARVSLRHGVSFELISGLTKQAMIEVANREFTIQGRKQSASRIAVLTGIHRKDVARTLAESPSEDSESRARVAYAARVISGWHRDKRFKDARGRPRALGFDAPSPSFVDLVKRYGGAVDRLRDGRIRLVASAYVPAKASAESVQIFGEDVADLVRTIGQNLEVGPDAGLFQRRVAYDNLPAESIERIHATVRKDGQAFLEALDRLMAASDRDSNPDSRGTGRKRAKVGLYFFSDDVLTDRESKK